jgi:hypothetical protein
MIPLEVLSRLALGDLDEEEELRAEEHVLSCSRCARVLEGLVRVGDAVRELPSRGVFRSFVTPSLVDRFEGEGLITRRYALTPGARVACTVAPDDVLVLVTFDVPLESVRRVDIEVFGERATDVPFDVRAQRLYEISSAEPIRALPSMSVDFRALAVAETGEERVLGEYALDHTAMGSRASRP